MLLFDKLIDLRFSELGRIGEAAAIGGWVCLHCPQRFLVNLRYALEFRLGTSDGAFHAQPHFYVEALVCRLERDLATQNSTTGNYYILDAHGHSFR